MSRVAKNPVALPKGVTANVDGETVTVKGAKGALTLPLRRGLSVVQEGQSVRVEVAERNRESLMHAGSLRAHIANVVHGVSQGYERKLELVGVGYRAQAQGRNLNLTLGFSHPVVYVAPEGVT
jgi:large subunit ribosomal protein L6